MSYCHNYISFRELSTDFSVNISDWQGVDDEPTAGSQNVVKSGGAKKNMIEERNNIFATLEGKGLFTPLKTDYYNNLTLLNNNLWYQHTTNGNCYISPIPVGLSKLRVTANNDENSIIALLKSDAHENGTRADYAEGWTYNDGVIQAGNTAEISLPNDCKYIFIKASASPSSTTDDMMPSSIEMIASIREDVNTLESDFSTLAGTVESQGDSINDLNNTTVKTITQSFTDAQKGQVRTNIGAVDITEVEDTIADFSKKVEGVNKFSKEPGYYTPDGTWRTYLHNVFLNVEEGDVIRLYNWQTSEGVSHYEPKTEMTICAFDANGNAITASGQQMGTASSYTVPSGIVKVCVGVNTAINTKACVTLNQETPPTVETPYVAPRYVVITDSTLTDEELPANSKAVGDALALKMGIGAVTPKDIKQTPFLEDFRFCEIMPNKVASSITAIEGKNYIVWDNSAQGWYTLAINISSYKDLLLVSDILPQSAISKFLTIGVDNGETNIEYVAMINSDGSFTLSPNAYVFDALKMLIRLSELYSTYSYRGNIVLYIKMPTDYKINWLASGMEFEGYDWMKIGSYAKANLKKELKADNVKIVLPSTIYTVIGHEMNIYHDSVILCDNIDRYGIVERMGSLTTAHHGQNERIKIVPSSETNGVSCSLSVYDKLTFEVIAKKTFTAKAKADVKYEKKVIFIGDSLTDRCIYPVEICQELGDNKLVSLGTRMDSISYDGTNGTVSATNFANEGRGGWSATDYVTQPSLSDVPNAFWNPNTNSGEGGFDFSYYMSTNNFDSVDCVVIALGTNDVGKSMMNANFDTIISSFREMIESIHAYSSSVKVIVSLTPHGAEPDGWAASTYSDQSTVFNYLQMKLVEKLIEEFEGETNVYLAPTYANIDYHNDFPTTEVAISARNPKLVKRQNNNVHFSVDSTNPVSQCWGYLKMADAIWYTMMFAFSE